MSEFNLFSITCIIPFAETSAVIFLGEGFVPSTKFVITNPGWIRPTSVLNYFNSKENPLNAIFPAHLLIL